MSPLSVLAPFKPKAKNAEWDESTWYCEEEECHDVQWESEEYEASKGKKGKGKGSKPKGKSKGKSAPRSIAPRPTQSSSTKNERSQPKSRPEARSCMTNDFLFAMITTKSKPTWRHSTWDGVDYVICTVIDPQKKLPVFKAGKWSLRLLEDDKIYLYGHDAKTMKHFTLQLNSNEPCKALDRTWFGEMWFPVQRHNYHVQSSIREDCLVDPTDLV